MSDAKELGITPATAGTGGGGGSVSLGKGAWDCDANREIPPEKEVRRCGAARDEPFTRGVPSLVAPTRPRRRGTLSLPLTPCAQAEVFEEIATMEFPFEGIPTVPPRKDMDHFAFFCDGCRYRYASPCSAVCRSHAPRR